MSFLVGTFSGALVASGIYYGFSNLISSRTAQHRADLAEISRRFTEPPPPVAALTAPASARVVKHEFRGLMQNSWNSAVSGLYTGALRESEKAGAWGWKLLYGGDAQPREDVVDEPRIE